MTAVLLALLGSLGGQQQDSLQRFAEHVAEVQAQQAEKPRRGINFSFEELWLLNAPLRLRLHWGFDLPEVRLASDVQDDKYVLQEADCHRHPATCEVNGNAAT